MLGTSAHRHIGTSEYYRELINQTETVQSELSNLEHQHSEVQSEFSKVKADVSKEMLKNSAADVGSKLIDGVSSLLGTPKVVKTDMENRKFLHSIGINPPEQKNRIKRGL